MRVSRTLLLGVVISIAGVTDTGARAQQPAQSQVAPSLNHEAMERKAEQDAVNVVRKLDAIEAQLKQEERRMNSRFKQLGQMRQTALKRNDAAALKRVELLEQQAVKQYEARIEQILKSYGGTGQATAAAKANTKRTPAQVTPPVQPKSRTPQPTKAKPRSNRLRLWPFSR